MIKEEEVEKGAKFIRENADTLAKARAERIYLEQFRKSKKALLMNECDAEKVNAKEIYAYAHPEYKELLESLKIAIEQEEFIKWKIIAAQAMIEIWRTQQANNRNIDRLHT